jgi:transcription factor TFIIIB component B''
MFKKKGGPAFKPKVPSIRSRQAQAAPSSSRAADGNNEEESQSHSASVASSTVPSSHIATTTPVAPEPVQSQQIDQDGPPRTTATLSKTFDPPPVSAEAASGTVAPPTAANISGTTTQSGKGQRQQASQRATRRTATTRRGSATRAASVSSTASSTNAEASSKRSAQSNDQLQIRRPEAVLEAPDSPTTPATRSESAAPSTEAAPSEQSTAATSTSAAHAAPLATTALKRTGPPNGQATTSEAPATSAPRKKRVRISKTRTTQQTDTAATEGDEETQPQKRRKKKRALAEGSEEAPRRKRVRKSRAQAEEEEQEEDGQNGEGHLKKRKRSVTPEDAEELVVDWQALKMSDLTRDLRIGKKSSRHDELVERERQIRATKAKKARAKRLQDGEQEEEGNGSQAGTPASDREGEPSTAPATGALETPALPASSGLQYRVVDGNIVVDETSLTVDRHARAAAAAGNVVTVEENDFTRLTTSASFQTGTRKLGPNRWTEEETELFFRGLLTFGTVFSQIAPMFPKKTERQVKNKFLLEDRKNPSRITELMRDRKGAEKISMEEYQTLIRKTLSPTEDIMAELAAADAKFEAEQKKREDEAAETLRRRREELYDDEPAGANANAEESSAAETSPLKKSRGGKKRSGSGKGKGRKPVESGLA